MEGGRVIARTLFGDVNPGGKLPFTMVTDESDLPFFDKNATSIEYGSYHGYTLADKTGRRPAFPFGFGLSYTSFEIGAVSAAVEEGLITVTATLRNTGDVTGDEVIQIYAGFPQTGHEMPVKRLCGFKRISVEPGTAEPVSIRVDTDSLRWYDPDDGQWKLDHGEYTLHVGTSSDPADLTSIHVTL